MDNLPGDRLCCRVHRLEIRKYRFDSDRGFQKFKTFNREERGSSEAKQFFM